MTMDIISKEEAKRKGLKRFFTGKPCIHGHYSERFISGGCVSCNTIRQSGLIRVENKVCKYCGKEFDRSDGGYKYCSNYCRSRVHMNRMKGRADNTKPIQPKDKDAKACKQCGVLFVPRVESRKFCSRSCAFEWQGRNKKPSSQMYRAVYFVNCENCELLFTTNISNKKYCSNRCRVKSSNVRHGRSTGKKKKQCKECGCDFDIPMTKGRYPVYCSSNCRIKHYPKSCQYEHNKENMCVICGNLITGEYLGSPYCSRECVEFCNTKHPRDNNCISTQPIEFNILYFKQCKYCDTFFVSRWSHQTQCGSQGCISAQITDRTMTRRAAIHNVSSELVRPIDVFERDGWVCQSCNKQLRQKDRGKMKPESPEIDHVIPISRGGPHTYDNLQTMCKECNGRKGNSLDLHNNEPHIHADMF